MRGNAVDRPGLYAAVQSEKHLARVEQGTGRDRYYAQ